MVCNFNEPEQDCEQEPEAGSRLGSSSGFASQGTGFLPAQSPFVVLPWPPLLYRAPRLAREVIGNFDWYFTWFRMSFIGGGSQLIALPLLRKPI